MSFLDTKRIPIMEAMRIEEEVFMASPSSGQTPRDRSRDADVEQAIRLGMHQGVILEVGTGAGERAMKLARRCSEVTVLGIDPSEGRIGQATEAAEREGLRPRVHFQVANLQSTRFKAEYFDAVWCDGVLHRAADPIALLNEIARVVKRDGAVLVRDLRRPSIFSTWWHTRWFGRRYSGERRAEFAARIRASYSYSEWRRLLQASAFQDSAQLFVQGLLHIGIERPAQGSRFADLAARREHRDYLVETEGWRKGRR